jgi:linoleoyl-CoA desaturase
MKNSEIRFIAGDEQKQFASTLRKNVNNYFSENKISPKGDERLAFKTATMLSFYIVPFVLFLTIPMHAWEGLLLVIVMGIGVAGIGMSVMHDAVHGAYSRKPWLNELMGGTLYLIGSNVATWKIQHNVLHHTLTNINGMDEDIASKGPVRLSEHVPLHKFHRYQYIYVFFFYGLMTLSKLFKDFTQLLEYKKAKLTSKHGINTAVEFPRMVLYKVVYLAVIIGLPLWLTDFKWWQVLLGFFFLHWTTGCILSVIFQMAHVVEGADQPEPDKTGVIANDWAIHQLNTTSDFARNNLFLGWYIGGLNFQIEHHLFPNISHIHYRNISPILEKTAFEFGIKYNLKPTFFSALASHVRRLKELGRPVLST